MVKSINKAKTIIFLSSMLIMSYVLLSACSKSDIEDTNIEVINNVLELQFTGPDEELIELIWNPKYTTVVNNKEVNEELDKYVAEEYGPYFIDSSLTPFLNIGMSYQIIADKSGHKLSFKDIVIEQSEKMSNRYTFVATVGYQKNGEKEKTANVSGEFIFSTKEEGKIGRFQYRDDDGLLDIMY